MAGTWLQTLAVGLATIPCVFASTKAFSNLYVSHEGEPAGFFKNVSGGMFYEAALESQC